MTKKAQVGEKARDKLKELPFNIIAPNVVTMFGLTAGLTSIRFSAMGNWKYAVIAIFLACIFDGLDGSVARMLQGSSKFGAEFDSLSDFVSFGVSPAMLLFFWSMHNVKGVGWVLCVMFAVCMALRLARFNIMLDADPQPEYWKHFFVGVPAPAAAITAITPVISSLGFDLMFVRSPIIVGCFLILIALMMVSHIPTFSLKKAKVPAKLVVPVFLIFGFLAGFMLNNPFATMTVLAVIYLLFVPVGIICFLRFKKQIDNQKGRKLEKQDLPKEET